MSNEAKNEQTEGRSSKVRNGLFWFALLVLAVFPFPLWP